MKKLINGLFVLAVIMIQSACTSVDSTSKPYNLLDQELSQFTNIYDYGSAKMEGDELVLSSTGNWFFTTKKTYKDFILTAEIKMPDVSEYSNSGIMFRGQIKETEKGTQAMGYQAEVDPSPRRWSGGLYDQGRRKWLNPLHETRSAPDEDFKKNFIPQWSEKMSNAYKHLQWNSYRIECRGDDLKIFVNDVLITHVIDVKDKEGFVGLQHHGSKVLKETGKTTNYVRFRNVFIEELTE